MSDVPHHKALVQRALRWAAGESVVAKPPAVPPKLGEKYLHILKDIKSDHLRIISDLKERLEGLEINLLSEFVSGKGELIIDANGKTSFLFHSFKLPKHLTEDITTKIHLWGQREDGDIYGPDAEISRFINSLSGYYLAGMGMLDYFADFDYYSKLQKISGYETTWLSLGLNPRSNLVGEAHRPSGCIARYDEIVEKNLELFDRNFGLKTDFCAENLEYLFQWLDQSKFDAHPSFRPMLESVSRNSKIPANSADILHPEVLQGSRKAGRPRKYDWDAFYHEIIRSALELDALPEKQADLQKQMQEWFLHTYGKEPSESSVAQKISQIYIYLEKGKN